jgi:phosphate/sulfate permease
MKDGQSSPEAAAALRHLTALYGTAHAAGPSEAIALRMSQRLLAKVIESRSVRLSVAAAKEGPLTWSISVIATLAVFTFAWFFGLPSLATKLVMGGLFAMAVMTVVYVIFILRDPFSGTLGLSATPYLELAG